jgi:hypothetical protein
MIDATLYTLAVCYGLLCIPANSGHGMTLPACEMRAAAIPRGECITIQRLNTPLTSADLGIGPIAH